ncbi:MAG: hypothetical protein QM736_11005 [Vicinamibacterales bacterium]
MNNVHQVRRLPAAGVSALTLVLVALASGCGAPDTSDPLAEIADRYLRLATALTTSDPQSASGDTAAAATGVAASGPSDLDAIATQATDAIARLDRMDASTATAARRQWLRAQLTAVATRARQQNGATLSLVDELRDLYGVDPPGAELQDVGEARQRLERLLPGAGSAAARLDDFDATVVVPAPRLPALFERALEECRARTRDMVALPSDESVTVKYVVGESWSGFSRYEGHGYSVVSVNTDTR